MAYRDKEKERAAARLRHARWRERNREKLREKSKEWHAANPHYMPDYRADYGPDIREVQLAWDEAHTDKVRESKRNYARRKRAERAP